MQGARGEACSLHEILPPVEIDALLDSVEEGILLLDGNLRVVAVNQPVLEVTGAEERELLGLALDELLSVEEFHRIRSFNETAEPDAQLTIQDGAIRTVDDGQFRADFHFMPRRPSPPTEGLVMTYCPRSAEGMETVGARQQERLGLVNQFNTTLRRVSRSIINPTSRGDLESIVCSELANATPYEFAVVIGQDSAGTEGTPRPRAWAGIDDGVVQEFLTPLDAEEDASCPLATALETGDVQVATGINRHPRVASGLAETGLSVGSVAVVPIRYKNLDYGVLAVYSAREGPFEDYELGMLKDLGEIVGFAYNAVDKNQLLATDSVVELEIEITDSDSFLVGATALTECTLSLESVVPTDDGGLLAYHRVEGGPIDQLLEVAEDSPRIESAEVIREHEGVSWVVFERTDRSPVEILSENNINVREVVAAGGAARYRLEVSPTRDIEGVLAVMGTIYEDFHLAAKRRRDRPAYTSSEFRHEVLDSLTAKQQQTLEAAFQHGYFNRPRGSTAEEIATQLDIASSTFHQHLRAAMSKLMSILLDSESHRHPLTR